MSITASVFALCFVGGLLASLFRHPIFGLYTYLWAFYLDPAASWWGDELPDLRYLQIAAIVTMLSVIRLGPEKTRAPWYANGGARIIIMFVLWMWIQHLWAVNPTRQLDGAILFTKHLIVFYFIYRILIDEQTMLKFALANVAGCFWLGWDTLGSAGRLEQVSGPFSGSNQLGMHMTTGLMFASMLFLGMKGWVRWLAFACIPFILNTIILAQSRGTFLGLLCAGLAGLYLIPKVLRKWYIGAGALGIVLFLMLAHDEFWDRMETLMAPLHGEVQELDRSATSRLDIARAGLEVAIKHPLGGGHRSTPWLTNRYVDQDEGGVGRRAHNTFMALLAEQGIPGALLYVLIAGWTAYVLLRLKAMDKQGLPLSLGVFRAILGASLTGVFVSGQFSNMMVQEVQFWCFAMLALVWEFAKRPATADVGAPALQFESNLPYVSRQGQAR